MERGANAVGMSIPPPAPLNVEIESEARDRSPIKNFFCMGGQGYNAANGLISREIPV